MYLHVFYPYTYIKNQPELLKRKLILNKPIKRMCSQFRVKGELPDWL